MKKYTRFLSCFVIASMLLINGCTSKTAVDNTPTDSDVIETTIEEVNSVSQTTEAVYVPETTPVETTEFDLNDYSFENVYGSQIINYLNHQYYFNGEPVPIVESNYYFVNTFLELSNYGNYYGAYPVTSEGFLDLAAAVPTNSDGTPPRFETFGDFYRQYSETMLYSTLIVLENAKEMNLTLDEDTINSIDELIVNLDENAAKPNNMTLDDYLALYYGPDCNEESFKQVLYNYYLNDVFTEYYISNYQYAEEDMIMSPTVRYALYYAPFGSEESVLSEAQDNAEGMFASCNNNIDTFAELGSAQYASGGNTEYGELTVTRGQTVPAFDAWCFDSVYAELKSQIIKRKTEFDHFIDFLENRTAWLSAPAEKEGPMAIEKGLLIRSVGVAKQLLRIKDTLMPQLDDEAAIIIGLFHDVGKVGIEGKPLFIVEEKVSSTSALGLSLNRSIPTASAPTYTINTNLVPMKVGVRSLFLVSQYMLLSDDEAQAITYAADTKCIEGAPSPYTTVLETAIKLQKNIYENSEAVANYSFTVIAP